MLLDPVRRGNLNDKRKQFEYNKRKRNLFIFCFFENLLHPLNNIEYRIMLKTCRESLILLSKKEVEKKIREIREAERPFFE